MNRGDNGEEDKDGDDDDFKPKARKRQKGAWSLIINYLYKKQNTVRIVVLELG